MDALSATATVVVKIMAVAATLLERGMCAKQEQEEGDGGSEWDSGTGLGEGEGLKDITDEIEDEDQMDGMKDEEQHKPEKNPDQPDADEDKAKDVSFDFDAELEPERQPEKDENKDGEEDEENKEDLDKQLGDVDLSKGGEIDDKLWQGEDEDEKEDDKQDEGKDEGKQKDDIETKGGRKDGDTDVVAGEEDDDDKQQDSKDNEGDSKDQQPDGKGEDGEAADDNASNGEEEFDDQGEEGDHHDVTIPNRVDDPNGEGEGEGDGDGEGDKEDSDLDLEGDLNLDPADGGGEDAKEEDGAQGMEDALDQKGQGEEEAGAEDGKDEENNGEEPDGKDEEGKDEEGKDDEGKEGDLEETAQGDDPDKPEDPQEEKAEGNVGASDPIPEQQEPEGGDEAAEKEKEQEEKNNLPKPDQAPEGETPFGVNEEGDSEAKQQTVSAHDAASGEAPSGGQEQPSAGGQTHQTTVDGAKEEKQQKPDQAPNPFESNPEATERWLQKLNIMGKEDNDGDDGGGAGEDEVDKTAQYQVDENATLEGIGETNAENEEGKAPPNIEQEEPQPEEQEAEKQGEEAEKPDNEQDGKSQNKPKPTPTQGDLDANADLGPQNDKEAPAPEKADRPGGIVAGERSETVLQDVATLNPAEEQDDEDDDVAGPEIEVETVALTEQQVADKWAHLETTTTQWACSLSEQLRIVLEPTLKGRLQGDYKTGKRISMRKVIPYIASSFRRDKIWLRRTKASKRQYQVLVCIDNSFSMSECGVADTAMAALFTLCSALARVEVGEFGVCSFGGEKPELLIPLGHHAEFGRPMAEDLIRNFTFKEQSETSHNRGLTKLLQLTTHIFDHVHAASIPVSQMALIVTDGRFNKAAVRQWVHTALSRQQYPLLIIVDRPKEEGQPSTSVFDLKAVQYENGTCMVSPYLSPDFPFPFYVVIQDMAALPRVLADVVRQWFEMAVR